MTQQRVTAQPGSRHGGVGCGAIGYREPVAGVGQQGKSDGEATPDQDQSIDSKDTDEKLAERRALSNGPENDAGSDQPQDDNDGEAN